MDSKNERLVVAEKRIIISRKFLILSLSGKEVNWIEKD